MHSAITSIKSNLEVITKAIIENVPVEEIYLFGSYAYGTPTEDSDIDLYLVFKDDMQMREFEALATARKSMFGIQNKSIDLLGQKKQKFLYRSTGFATIEKDVFKKGIKLYG
ncbi:MAG: nucleotidyltransferase domain-containing protein [Spirochaetaceae bacterium]|jgi:predicted nucleotidyltransferase|nr:nucleotidyltransferase domain-containing protein [Spirochaetaceae bacterium]